MATSISQSNLQTLTDYDYEIIQPASGEQACGDIGEGRLPEPEQLLEYVQYFIARQITPQVLAGKNVTITAGPTIEAIDPVRYHPIIPRAKWVLRWQKHAAVMQARG